MTAPSTRPRAALALVVAEGFLGRLTFGMVSFALPLYAFSLGLSLAEIGVVVTLRTLVAIVLKPIAGTMADRVGIRTVYLAGTLARVLAAGLLLNVDDVVGLSTVRVLQGASAAGRDVASLSVIARDASARIGTVYSWYSTAKHIGGVAGAGIAGAVLQVTDGSFPALFTVVLVLSLLPMAAAWFALRETSTIESNRRPPAHPPPTGGRLTAALTLARELTGPASLGMLVATSAYMVHGLFPVLATDYAGLTPAETGAIYSLSALVFVITGPAFGWVVDRRGYSVGTAWRSIANIGSSMLYLLSPNLVGFAGGRALDDSGKAAFRPAWATLISGVAHADPPKRGRRLGLLDTSETVGEALGPVLAGLLWQTGGVLALFGVRIGIAAAAEIIALRSLLSSGRRRGASHPEPA